MVKIDRTGEVHTTREGYDIEIINFDTPIPKKERDSEYTLMLTHYVLYSERCPLSYVKYKYNKFSKQKNV